MKWGWDFNRDLREDEEDSLVRVRHRSARRRDEILLSVDESIDLTNPIQFRVEAVQGGTLVETRWYDAKTDNHERKLHIITGDENLSDAIGKIVTMELLKR